MLALLRFIGREPELLVDHVTAYADLAGEELGAWQRHWVRRLVFGAIAVCAGLAALVLAGVALLLAATLPTADPAPWRPVVMVGVPALPALVALLAAWAARGGAANPPLAELKAQWQQDLGWLRQTLGEAAR